MARFNADVRRGFGQCAGCDAIDVSYIDEFGQSYCEDCFNDPQWNRPADRFVRVIKKENP
jgi:hypothetical protein